MTENIKVVSERNTIGDYDQLSKYISGKNALVLQGGGQKSIFTAGVLDAFNLSSFDPFELYFGTSAGAMNLCAFLCRQCGLGKSFITELTTRNEFFNLFSYIRKKQYLNLSWALDRIMDFPYRLDVDMGRCVLQQKKAYAAVTQVNTLKDDYLPVLESDWREVLLATCAIPALCDQPVEVRDQPYVDGGISAAIPVQEAWRQGARFIAVIRTECPETSSVLPEVGESSPAGFKLPLDYVQNQWQLLSEQWRSSLKKKMSAHSKNPPAHILNGGRWLFGADNLFRLGDLLGRKFDSRLADMLMIHFQTYELTLKFLESPPDDVFIIQIAPSMTLRSGPLLSNKEDLLHDYALGLEAGYNFIESWESAKRVLYSDDLNMQDSEFR
ncbi:Patatin-like phospholipase [Vibrio aerogenes CECT 7868]|uniref:Patatin-like phospholipase n=1 Tax=Vibrio aerogenes CECT 7868 TaxID=1216006 RepID=A0A1M6DAV7_9VIBR|nr:patatin-like phospholipase family protein [Vibrio aerogenes]SHI70241.1 Patatin-like phospholipase [Vibrio aerogenes CECT 7868]